MGGTLSAPEALLSLRLFLRPPASTGPSVSAFEAAFARAVHAPSAVSFGSGRVALWAILQAAGIGARDDVVVPGYTCVAVPNAVRFVGAHPVYADIDPLTFNVTAETCSSVLTPRTRALVVAHTYGRPAPMEALCELARARGLLLIEDVAHALGSEYRGRPVGSLGDAAFFSTEHSKTITTGLGGVATAADAALAAGLRAIQSGMQPPSASRVRRILLPHLIFGLCYGTRHPRLGEWLLFRTRLHRWAEWSTQEREHQGLEPATYRWRMGETQALLGLEQLKRLPRLNAARLSVCKSYDLALCRRNLEPPATGGADRVVYVRFPYLSRRRDVLLTMAQSVGLELGLWFEAPVHPGQTDLGAVGYTHGDCPVAERTSRNIVNLPCHPGITAGDIDRYVELLAQVEG
jgi:perosamine synthetase